MAVAPVQWKAVVVAVLFDAELTAIVEMIPRGCHGAAQRSQVGTARLRAGLSVVAASNRHLHIEEHPWWQMAVVPR